MASLSEQFDETVSALKEQIEGAPPPTPGEPDRQRRKLTRSGAHVGGGGGVGTIAFGLIFVAAGAFIVLAGLKLIPVESTDDMPPTPIMFALASIFGLPGIFIVGYAVRGMARRAGAHRRAAMNPREPWLADHPWNTQFAQDDSVNKILTTLIMMLFLGLFMTPFNYFMVARSGPWFAWIFIGLFDLIVVAFAFNLVYLVIRWIKYGRSRVRFRAFPFFLGEMFEVEFVADRTINAFESIEFTLRCIETRTERTTRTSGGRTETTTTKVYYQVWADTYKFDETGDHPGGAALPVTFLLPSERALTSTLLSDDPQFWELEINAKTPGVDFGAAYLVPVYARVDS